METQVPNMPSEPVKVNNNGWITTASIALFILLSLGTVIFLYNQNRQLKKMLAEYQRPSPTVTPTSTPIPTPDPNMPTLDTISKGSKVVSPLKVTGVVPAGWMFEGSFPIKLTDLDGKTIKETQAKEVLPGSWQDGEPVPFSATITFKTSAKTGYLVLQNDNPSGLTEQEKTFSVAIVFQDVQTSKYTCPATEYVDCMPGPNEGIKLECTSEYMTWARTNCPGFKGGAY